MRTHIIAKVRNIHADGSLIAKANKTPKRGDSVNDGQNNLVGVVHDVFGPENAPYVSIKPRGDKKSLHRLVGEAVYIGERRRGTWTTKEKAKKPRT